MEKNHICKICYREFSEDRMKKNFAGNIIEQCIYCYDLIGKGPGYGSSLNDKEAETWLKGAVDRKEELIKANKIKK